MVVTVPGEKLLIGRCRPVRNWTRRKIPSLFLCRKLHLFLGKSTKNAATRAALFDSTHTRLTALYLGLPGWAGTYLDFTEARDSEWQWHQLGHMQGCTALQTDNPTTQFFTGRMPFLPPSQQRQSTFWLQYAPNCLSVGSSPQTPLGELAVFPQLP